jgi:CubicO group peptidase (beta-lactamase class C family)
VHLAFPKKLFALVALVAVSLVALRFATRDRYAGVRDLIRRELAGQALPSLAVAVVHHGRIEWEEAFGWADREHQRRATVDTMYSLASVSKPITATGLMTLVRAGKIDLDRPINDYLGEAKLNVRVGDPSAATVRRVANHSSGLPLHNQFFYADQPFRRPPMDETIRRYGNLVTMPGERYQYSNLGFGVLDHVIARASGQTYVDFMRREVFEPLGLTRTSVDIAPGLEAFAATRYGTDGRPIPFYDFDHPGGSAVFASVHDLARFALFHLKAHLPDQKPILDDALIDEMHRPTQTTGGNAGYGVGFATAKLAGGYTVVQHDGGMGGVSTVLRIFPSEGLAIIVLSNSRGLVTVRVANAIQKIKLSRWKPPENPRAPSTPDFVAPPEIIGEWSGKIDTYAGARAITISVRPPGEIQVQIEQQPPAPLKRAAFNRGYLTGEAEGDLLTDDTRGNQSHLFLSLKLRGDLLNGAVTSIGRNEPRIGNALTHWAELHRRPADGTAAASKP